MSLETKLADRIRQADAMHRQRTDVRRLLKIAESALDGCKWDDAKKAVISAISRLED